MERQGPDLPEELDMDTTALHIATLEDCLKVLAVVQKTLIWLGNELDPDGGPDSGQHISWLVAVVLAQEEILPLLPLIRTDSTQVSNPT